MKELDDEPDCVQGPGPVAPRHAFLSLLTVHLFWMSRYRGLRFVKGARLTTGCGVSVVPIAFIRNVRWIVAGDGLKPAEPPNSGPAAFGANVSGALRQLQAGQLCHRSRSRDQGQCRSDISEYGRAARRQRRRLLEWRPGGDPGRRDRWRSSKIGAGAWVTSYVPAKTIAAGASAQVILCRRAGQWG